MKELSYLLVTDGSSDRALIPILNWLLRQHLADCALDPQWVDPTQLPNPPENSSDRLAWRIRRGLYLYDQADVLFVHRDAERQSRDQRIAEIQAALTEVSDYPPPVYIIPVKMFEAWLLFDEEAIRLAAGNPNGRVKLKLPPLNRIESLPNPKTDLYVLLEQASQLKGRRLKKFRPQQQVHRLAELIGDYAPLRQLPAFQALERNVRALIEEQGW
jgi:hypothetical protein